MKQFYLVSIADNGPKLPGDAKEIHGAIRELYPHLKKKDIQVINLDGVGRITIVKSGFEGFSVKKPGKQGKKLDNKAKMLSKKSRVIPDNKPGRK